ncbi:mediator of RNA polymerase II transcription subunit 19a-like isoform X2 [Argentina anserina]|uniref:mediator of RNA polymerase II transcription subunit 19a-like isoform X1 n=1 Tax=Argentina anserina TaxID=57926 RepID=UPI0021764A87|nr:mediator of RNA polymerase II transcription subunit 19a-like isoform X1 [Potentilla anserina]XP_050368060.1 mediator of RNA polymerase II transcription subunit 19a-like isoform X2 [Potentilla anserina]
MDIDAKRFGRGPRELGAAADLINQFRLCPFHEFFCKKSLPLSETHYLHNVVGDTKIRKGEGMELDQLLLKTPHTRERKANIHPFDFGMLSEAFRIKETTRVHLHSVEKGILTDYKERKHKKNKNKNKDRKKHNHIDNGGDADETIKNITNVLETVQSKEQPDRKRRLNGPEDLYVRENKRVRTQRH